MQYVASVVGLIALFVPGITQAALVPVQCLNAETCGTCELVTTVNNVVLFAVQYGVILAVLVIVLAGFWMVLAKGDVAQIQSARGLINNVVIGYVIILAAYLIISTILGGLLQVGNGIFQWDELECVYPNAVAEPAVTSLEGLVDRGTLFDPVTSASDLASYAGYGQYGPAGEPMPGDCSPENLMSLGMTQTQANVFSCLARPESGCNNNAQNPWTSARGVYQIVRGLNTPCHNLNIPECSAAAQAAGYNISGSLNCSQAFTGGTSPSNPSRPVAGQEQRFAACNAAASNFECNVAAALCLYNQDGAGYSPWLGIPSQNHHQAQRACVAQYAN